MRSSVQGSSAGRKSRQKFQMPWLETPPKLFEPMRLTSRRKNGAPGWAFGIQPFPLGGQQTDGHVDEPAVQQSNNQTGSAGHGGMDGMARELVAEDGVLGVGRAAPDK